MREIIEKWLAYAEADLEAAEILANSPKSIYSYQLAVLHCHQAIEKILKTFIISSGGEPKKVHNLIYLLEVSKLQPPKEIVEYIEELNPHYQPARYPDVSYKQPGLKYTIESAKHHLAKTQEVFKWVEKKLTPKQ